MAWVQIVVRPTRVPPFSSAVLAILPCLASLFVLGRIAWHYPALRLPASLFFAVLLLLVGVLLRRIRSVYAAVDPLAVMPEEEKLPKALRELIRTARWGSLMCMLLSLGVLLAWSALR